MIMCEEQRPDDGCFWYENSGAVDSRDCLSYERHVNSANFLFGDGHVKGISFQNAEQVARLREWSAIPGKRAAGRIPESVSLIGAMRRPNSLLAL